MAAYYPPYEGGVDAASADGVVLSSSSKLQPNLASGSIVENHPVSRSKNDRLPPLLGKEGSRSIVSLKGTHQLPGLLPFRERTG